MPSPTRRRPERRCVRHCVVRGLRGECGKPRHNGRERLACASPETHPLKGLGEHRQHREGEHADANRTECRNDPLMTGTPVLLFGQLPTGRDRSRSRTSRRDCQRPPTCFAFPGRWRPRFAARTGSDGCLVPDSMRARVDWTHAQHGRLRVATCMVSRGPACPGQSGYNKRLRELAHTMAWLIGVLGADTSVGGLDPRRVCSSTEGQTLGSGRLGPVRLLRLALPLLLGSAAASAVHLVHGLPLGWALTGANADERDVLMRSSPPQLLSCPAPGHR